MIIALHDYETDPSLPQKDGANLAHENISSLFRSLKKDNLKPEFHNLLSILRDFKQARAVLSHVDCVVSNVGPHAHYYFWLREKLGLNYRIIRDVRTALWSSYLLQEYLCESLLRPQDTLIVASNYTQGIYESIFPHLREYPSALCYPLTVAFPERPPSAHRALTLSSPLTLGYLGRLSEDKNFPSLIDLLISLNRTGDREYRLIACGDVHSANCSLENVRARLRSELGFDHCFLHLPSRNNDEIWDVLAKFDLLLFPSTSNLETLGRVLVEASYMNLPVVSGNHAAAPELVDSSGICNVSYSEDIWFDTHFDIPLGEVSTDDMKHVIRKGNLYASDCYLRYKGHIESFAQIVATSPSKRKPSLTQDQKSFLNRIKIELPPSIDREHAMLSLQMLATIFIDYHSDAEATRDAVFRLLLSKSKFPERTQRFIAKSKLSRGDFTNIGGIDIELCNLLAFHPRFQIMKEISNYSQIDTLSDQETKSHPQT